MNKVDVNDKVYFQVKQGGYKKQKIGMKVDSNYALGLQLDLQVGGVESSDDSQSLWWIALIVVGAVVIIGLVVYFVRKNKNKNKTSEASGGSGLTEKLND